MNNRRRKMMIAGQSAESETYPLEGGSANAPTEKTPAGSSASPKSAPPGRLVSLDAYRGFIMAVLAASGFGVLAFSKLDESAPVWQERDYAFWQQLAFHFDHPLWGSKFGLMGVSCWDLIQPAFMFMVGVAMPFSYKKRAAFGHSAFRRFMHAFWRALVLVLMGVFLYSLRNERTNWIFPNVLAQIGLGYVFAYALLGRRLGVQLAALVAILVGYWFYFWQYSPPADYDYAAVNASAEKGEVYEGRFSPWSKNGNAAHAFDVWFLNLLRDPPDDELAAVGVQHDSEDWAPELLEKWFFKNPEVFKYNSGGYQTLNFVPSIATTLLGILCGQLLLSRKKTAVKLGYLVGGGALCMVLGLIAGEFACPIVKRIWTPSWVLFSGAYVIWMLAAFYLLFDILPLRALAFPLAVVGMNSIMIYMMGQLIDGWTRTKVVQIHFTGVLQTLFGETALADDMYGRLIFPTAVFAVYWVILYWMYRQRYFVRV